MTWLRSLILWERGKEGRQGQGFMQQSFGLWPRGQRGLEAWPTMFLLGFVHPKGLYFLIHYPEGRQHFKIHIKDNGSPRQGQLLMPLLESMHWISWLLCCRPTPWNIELFSVREKFEYPQEQLIKVVSFM